MWKFNLFYKSNMSTKYVNKVYEHTKRKWIHQQDVGLSGIGLESLKHVVLDSIPKFLCMKKNTIRSNGSWTEKKCQNLRTSEP